jgi:hypothetical protein
LKDIFNEKYKTLKKEIEEDTRRCKCPSCSCSWISGINIVNMVILLKTIYICNAIAITISMTLFTEVEKINSKVHMKSQITSNSHSNYEQNG